MKSLNNAAFEAMFAGVTLTSEVDLNLRGTADVSAKTSIGTVAITGIPFDVPSSLSGAYLADVFFYILQLSWTFPARHRVLWRYGGAQ